VLAATGPAHLLACNEAAVRLLGDAVHGPTWENDAGARVRAIVSTATEPVHVPRIELVGAEGASRAFELFARRVVTPDGVVGFLELRDLTEHERVQRDRTLLICAVESAPLGIALVDRSLRYLWVNPAAAAMVGLSVEAHIGRTVSEVLAPEAAAQLVPLLRAVLETGQPIVDMEFEGATAQAPDVRRAIRFSYLPARGPDGELMGVSGIIRDVTEERAAVQAVRDREQKQALLAAVLNAEQAERAAISAAIHDDTVQVMTASLLALDRIGAHARVRGDTGLERLVADVRRTLHDATERARRLMFELRPAVLTELGLRAAIGPLAEETRRETGADVAFEAPAGRFPAGVEELAYRTLQEALANARKHSGASAIRVRVAERDGMLQGSVEDDGRGFDVDQALGPAGAPLHVGLQAAMERVQIAGGTLAVRSSPGAGTAVSFAIPIAR
jgi:PAS domain S-box-containing protein